MDGYEEGYCGSFLATKEVQLKLCAPVNLGKKGAASHTRPEFTCALQMSIAVNSELRS